LETVKALNSLFARETFVSNANTFTIRVASRLIEMALRDIDLGVRATAISVITLIDQTGILADEGNEHRDKIARLIFDHEPRIRKAVGPFMKALWEEKAEKLKSDWAGARGAKKKRAANIGADAMDTNLEWRALAKSLVQTSQSLDQPNSDPGTSRQANVLLAAASDTMTRAAAAVEALSNDVPLLQDWEGLVNYLLLDHSTADEDIWLMPEDEENFMLQILIVCVKREEKVCGLSGSLILG
jgi:cohesin complex subunit SA-1/2